MSTIVLSVIMLPLKVLNITELLSFKQFCDFLLNESQKTYLRPMLSPGDINWQLVFLIDPLFLKQFTAIFYYLLKI